MKIAVCILTTALTLNAPTLNAQSTGQIKPAAASAPDAAQVCVGCHGAQGEGNAAVGAPRIAGQSAYYLAKQLDSYSNGNRRNAVMEPIAKGLAPDARTALASYYSQLSAPG